MSTEIFIFDLSKYFPFCLLYISFVFPFLSNYELSLSQLFQFVKTRPRSATRSAILWHSMETEKFSPNKKNNKLFLVDKTILMNFWADKTDFMAKQKYIQNFSCWHVLKYWKFRVFFRSKLRSHTQKKEKRRKFFQFFDVFAQHSNKI